MTSVDGGIHPTRCPRSQETTMTTFGHFLSGEDHTPAELPEQQGAP
jgi:hypothetical protein